MKKIFIIKEYLYYLLHAKSRHSVHSPFLYHFIENVLSSKKVYYAFDKIQRIYENILNDNTVITIQDFGAGSHISNTKQKQVKEIAQTASRKPQQGRLLFKLINEYQSRHVLELGTSLGVGTFYLALGNEKAAITTIEGSEEIAHYASTLFKQNQVNNITQHIGNFDTVLPQLLQNKKQDFDFIFVDGNHRYEPTLRYFQMLLPHLSTHAIIVFDDIHWSKEMKQAWQEIITHTSLFLSVDLFYFGILFFNPDFKEKQHIILKWNA